MATTLLSYFKDNLKASGENTKYFNRDFLTKYICAYNEAGKENAPDRFYEKGGILYNGYFDEVYKTDFYNKNSCAYCAFLELWASYKKAMQYLNSFSKGARA